MKYRIDTLADMARIPAEAVPRFLIELPDILASVRMVQDSVASAEANAIAIPRDAFWQDDGKRDYSISLNANGKEILNVKGTHAHKAGEV